MPSTRSSMDAIKFRLDQLESIEASLYLERQAIVKRRTQEDEALHSRRQHEDQNYLGALESRDQEEDVRKAPYLSPL